MRSTRASHRAVAHHLAIEQRVADCSIAVIGHGWQQTGFSPWSNKHKEDLGQAALYGDGLLRHKILQAPWAQWQRRSRSPRMIDYSRRSTWACGDGSQPWSAAALSGSPSRSGGKSPGRAQRAEPGCGGRLTAQWGWARWWCCGSSRPFVEAVSLE